MELLPFGVICESGVEIEWKYLAAHGQYLRNRLAQRFQKRYFSGPNPEEVNKSHERSLP